MAKGARFERDICRAFSRWWDPDADDVLFWRTAGSGGRATRRTRTGKRTNTAHCSDVAAVDHRGAPLTNLVAFELKCGYPAASLHHLIALSHRGGESLYHEWIGQAITSSRAGRTPFWAIIHHQRGRETVILGPAEMFFRLDCSPDRCVPSFRLNVEVWSTVLRLVAVPFHQFLGIVTPDRVETVAELLC
jgi:hypothetical protein